MARRVFTVREVDELIPRLEEVLATVRHHLDQLQAVGEKLQLLDVLWGKRVQDRGNPDHTEWTGHRARAEQESRRIEEIVQREVVERGIRFPQGGLEHGLMDFPTVYRGRWVYLCWRAGEPRLVAWHELTGGFQGRKVLTPEQAAAMGEGRGEALPDDSILDF
jgi:hypothetical protein